MNQTNEHLCRVGHAIACRDSAWNFRYRVFTRSRKVNPTSPQRSDGLGVHKGTIRGLLEGTRGGRGTPLPFDHPSDLVQEVAMKEMMKQLKVKYAEHTRGRPIIDAITISVPGPTIAGIVTQAWVSGSDGESEESK